MSGAHLIYVSTPCMRYTPEKCLRNYGISFIMANVREFRKQCTAFSCNQNTNNEKASIIFSRFCNKKHVFNNEKINIFLKKHPCFLKKFPLQTSISFTLCVCPMTTVFFSKSLYFETKFRVKSNFRFFIIFKEKPI